VNAAIPDQVVVIDRKHEGPELLELCNAYVESEEVVFATPNFVSEYRRQATAPIPPQTQWHLANLAKSPGQKKGEDVGARNAWTTTGGKGAIVVAVLDDGVDIEHPNLKARIWRNPDSKRPDRNGRDFFLPDDHPDHNNPRPKQFTFPYDQMTGNDIHGTPCAGVIAAAGKGAYGIAFKCKVLPVKIFHADFLAEDERVADAIRYAALNADLVSCSWSGPNSPDTELALQDAQRLGRNGRGAAIFCASGNDNASVGYPAASQNAVAVGATTDQGKRAPYSNFGPELDLVAPSSGGIEGVFTTDVSSPPGRGFNIGLSERGGADGLHTNEFGGTSSATPLAAGVAALVLSVLPDLTRDELRELLITTADKIGGAAQYGPNGHSDNFGFGRVSAAKAVAAALASRSATRKGNRG
jgi:subtilisin family serine protease